MCIILLAKNYHPDYKLIIAANRDEFYNRPTAFLSYNKDEKIYCGTDLRAGGIWLGINRSGKLAAITNYRDPLLEKNDAESRGKLIKQYLNSKENPIEFISKLKEEKELFNNFNLILGDVNSLYYYSSVTNESIKIEDGIHGLSNAFFNTDWPKVKKGKNSLKKIISSEFSEENFFRVLEERDPAADNLLPDTGIDKNLEKILSPVFINTDKYGTRSSTVVMVSRQNYVTIEERSFDNKTVKINTSKYSFRI